MNRKLLPLTALAMGALIGAGCGSNGASETGTARNSGAASSTGAASNTGVASNTNTASKRHVTHQDRIASPSSAGSPPPPARRLPTQAPRMQQRPGTLGPEQMSTQSTHEGRRHE